MQPQGFWKWFDISVSLMLLIALPVLARGTTFTFTQTNWGGGATVNIPTHTDNRTGWTEYSATSTSMKVANAGADLQIATSTTSVTQTNDGSTNTGFNLTGAATSSTEVVGTGSAANVRLTGGTSWGVNETVDTTNEAGLYVSLALDSNNKAHLGYLRDATGGVSDRLVYATNATSSSPWSLFDIDSSIFTGSHTDLALDSSGNAYISYNDPDPATLSNNLAYATNVSGTWSATVIDAGANNTGAFTSIVIDSGGKAHISYYDTTNLDLEYATNASGSWATTTLDSVGNVGNNGTAIAIDSNDALHITYADNSNTSLRYGTNASGSWQGSTTTVDNAASVGTEAEIAVDSNNKVHISYYDATNTSLKYATNATSSSPWSVYTIDNAAAVGQASSIAVDSSNNIHISYYDATSADLKYATNASGSWVTSTLSSTDSVGTYTSIDIASNNYAHIAYYNATLTEVTYLTEALTYAASGTFTSGPMSLGVGALGWGALSWSETLNGGTITIKARSDADGDFSDATAWGSCTNITNGAALSTGSCVNDAHQYIQYQATLTTADTSTTPILSDVTIGYVTYATGQTLTSSIFNTESVTTAIDFLSWVEEATLPDNTSLIVELRTGATAEDITGENWYDFNSVTVNCTKTDDTVTCPASALPTAVKDVTDDQYLQYRVTLQTDDSAATPTLSEVQIGYVPDAGVGPTVNTSAATSLTSTTATLNGNIIGTGGTDVTVRGFAYGTDSTLATVIATTTDTSGQPFSTGAFTHSLTGLTCGTTYYVRAYATNTAGTGFGFDKAFTLTCDTSSGGGFSSGGGSDVGGEAAPPPSNDAEAGPAEEDPFRLPVFDHTERPRRFDPTRDPETPDTSGPDTPVIDEPPSASPPDSNGGGVPSAPEFFRTVTQAAQTAVKETVTFVASTTQQIVPVAIPLGALSGTLTFVGTALPITGGANIALSFARLWHLLLSALGFRRRRPWGVVYDSVTKHPIDPATIRLTDQYGTLVQTTYTDQDGRYGFLVAPGTYRIEVEKKNYAFPSTQLKGALRDDLYQNLYFGGLVTVAKDGTLRHNIPLDPIELDWKEFSAQSGKQFHFYSGLDRTLNFLARWIFRLGFLAALYALVTTPSLANGSIIALYAIIGLLRLLGFGPRPYGYLTDTTTGLPFAYALVTVRDAQTKVEITRTIADHRGRYYVLVPKGEYVVEVASKGAHEAYQTLYTSPALTAKHGVINESFRV